MNIKFKDIPARYLKARVSDIKEKYGPYGLYLHILFTIIEEDELANYKFSAIIKPFTFKYGKFYRWITNIMGQEPMDNFSTDNIIGKECRIFITKQKHYYAVADVQAIIE